LRVFSSVRAVFSSRKKKGTAALVIPGLLGPLGLQQAEAARDQSQAIEKVDQNAKAGVAAINANVGANVGVNVEDNEVAACAIIAECDIEQ
jgi:hypothetical protein